jgi:hypothetical protein
VTRLLAGLRLWERPEPWEPRVFASPVHASEWGLAEHVYRGHCKVYSKRERCQLPRVEETRTSTLWARIVINLVMPGPERDLQVPRAISRV